MVTEVAMSLATLSQGVLGNTSVGNIPQRAVDVKGALGKLFKEHVDVFSVYFQERLRTILLS
jgi:hypothetical protein